MSFLRKAKINEISQQKKEGKWKPVGKDERKVRNSEIKGETECEREKYARKVCYEETERFFLKKEIEI